MLCRDRIVRKRFWLLERFFVRTAVQQLQRVYCATLDLAQKGGTK